MRGDKTLYSQEGEEHRSLIMDGRNKEVEQRLEYLDLEIGQFKYVKTCDNVNILCFDKSNLNRSHIFHSEDFQLNTLIDIAFSNLHNTSTLSKSYDIIFRNILDFNA